MNLIDNSIYWLGTKGAKRKRIYLGTTSDFPHGPAIIVADDGPGFMLCLSRNWKVVAFGLA
jgi:hypothetical protein